jgi:hypothetical protein
MSTIQPVWSGTQGVVDEAKRRLFAIFAHNHNEVTRMARAAQAKQLGLPPSEFATPYPGTQQSVVTNNTGGGLVKGAVLSAVLLAGGAGAGLGVRQATSPAAVQDNPAATQPAPAAKQQAYDAVWQELQPDGTWKEVRRQRLK